MAMLVSIVGAKGGTGKTTLTHMLCYGLGLLGERTVCVMTDPGREPPPPGSLPYVFADGREAAARSKILNALRSREDWYGVIDGGANSMGTDEELAAISDLVFVPFRDSAEDMRVACRDLERLPHALALPSQWPTNRWQFQAAQNLLESIPAHLQARVVAPVFALSSSKLLLQTPPPVHFPTPVNNACRAIARYTLRVLARGLASLEQQDTGLAASRRVAQLLEASEAKRVAA
jgi:chromosome partitioning protein